MKVASGIKLADQERLKRSLKKREFMQGWG
jgi:hypothetical protein